LRDARFEDLDMDRGWMISFSFLRWKVRGWKLALTPMLGFRKMCGR